MAEAARPRGPQHERHLYDDEDREFMYVRHDGHWIIVRLCMLGVPVVIIFAYLMWFLFSHMH